MGDRVVALDMLVGIAIGFIAIIAIKTGFALYIEIAIALGLVSFWQPLLSHASFCRAKRQMRKARPAGQSCIGAIIRWCKTGGAQTGCKGRRKTPKISLSWSGLDCRF